MTPKKILKLREKIATRTFELGIIPVFDERGHHYKQGFDGEEYRSITTKLQTVKDPGLMHWYQNRSLEYIQTKLPEGFVMAPGKIIPYIEEAKKAPVNEFQGAGNIGTAVHSTREAWFRNWIETGDSDILKVEFPNVDNLLGSPYAVNSHIASFEAIKRCITNLKAEPLACELPLIDHKVRVGGTGDDIWAVPIETKTEHYDPQMGKYIKIKIRWEIWFVDLKTSNIGNKDSYMLQVASYVHMFEKLYKIKVDKVFILHTDKERFGDYELIPVKEPKRLWEIAKVAFKLSDMLEEVKGIKKLHGVTI